MYKDSLLVGSTIKTFDNIRMKDEPMLISETLSFELCDETLCSINIIIDQRRKIKKWFSSPLLASDLKNCFKLKHFNDPLHNTDFVNAECADLPNISIPAYHLMACLKASLETVIADKKAEKDIVYLEVPITVHAKTSNDMNYEWSGNQYGDTSTFYIVGYQIALIIRPEDY